MMTGCMSTHMKDRRAVCIADATGPIFKGATYRKLAPTANIRIMYSNGGTWDRYVEMYRREVLKHLDPVDVVTELCALVGCKDFEDDETAPIIMCFCKAGMQQCHRIIVRDWLKESIGYKMKELPPTAEIDWNYELYGARRFGF